MGMFDYVVVDNSVKLPSYSGNQKQDEFQTKDFDCEMRTYRLTKNGLMKELIEHESVPLEERSGVEFLMDERDLTREEAVEEAKGTLHEYSGAMNKKTVGWEKVDFHGIMRFYNSEYRYKAKFTDGVLENIKLIDKH